MVITRSQDGRSKDGAAEVSEDTTGGSSGSASRSATTGSVSATTSTSITATTSTSAATETTSATHTSTRATREAAGMEDSGSTTSTLRGPTGGATKKDGSKKARSTTSSRRAKEVMKLKLEMAQRALKLAEQQKIIAKCREEAAMQEAEYLKKENDVLAARLAIMEVDTEDEDFENEDEAEEDPYMQERIDRWVSAENVEERNIQERRQEERKLEERKVEERKMKPQEELVLPPPPQIIIEKVQEPKSAGDQLRPCNKITEDTKPPTKNEERSQSLVRTRGLFMPRKIPDLPKFGGEADAWFSFRNAYFELSPLLSEQENLSRLRVSIVGQAKKSVSGLFNNGASCEVIMKRLEARFGKSSHIGLAYLQKLKNTTCRSHNTVDVLDYCTEIANGIESLKALKQPEYLMNPEIVKIITDKLSPVLKDRFYQLNKKCKGDLIVLGEFMDEVIDEYAEYGAADEIKFKDRRELKRSVIKKTQRSYHVDTQRKQASRPSCQVCKKEGHRAGDCTKFKNADVNARWALAKENKLCYRCLQRKGFNHHCKYKPCGKDGCSSSHHALLHNNVPRIIPHVNVPKKHEERPEAHMVGSARDRGDSSALLKIIPVELTGPRGTFSTYALLDDGSTCTLVEATVADAIGATGPPTTFYIEGLGGARATPENSKIVTLRLRGRNAKQVDITARTIGDMKLTTQSIPRDTVKSCEYLRDIEHELLYDNGTPTILVGQDNFELLIPHQIRKGAKNQPAASLTELGWVLHGTCSRATKQCRVNHIITKQEEDSMEALMKEHFALESIGVTPRRSYNDKERRALQILESTTKRLPAGGYEAGLLWRKDDIQPPSNYDTALKRLVNIEDKLNKDKELKKRYQAQLNIMFEEGYAEPAPRKKSPRLWYLPHFAVINPAKPEKLRIVHDAAAKTRGVSLNDMLLSGPDLLQSLPGVLMRFRQRAVAVTADIKDMFMRVSVVREDRDMQRFLWRDCDRDIEPREYRMKSVIFGATSSPSTAIYVKNKNAEDFKEQFPAAARAIVHNHYCDDYIVSFDSVEEAIKVSNEVAYIHSFANFFLKHWASNSQTVVSTIAPLDESRTFEMAPEKILGMVWNPKEDTITFRLNTAKIPEHILAGEKTPTKREALRVVMSIFDPLGIATPVTIQAKKILQDVWRSGVEWDDKIEDKEAEAWNNWMKHVNNITQLKVLRCYEKLATAPIRELHTFVDASSAAYAAVVYWRVIEEDGSVHISLITAKGRVAPLKTTSIPRLELQAAVLGCRLAQTAIEEHDIQPTRRVFWSDSRTVLTWLKNGPRDYKPYVSHRIAEINECTKTREWRWVPTKENVADDATRDIPTDFGSEHRWFHGPLFLQLKEEEWPCDIEESKKEDIEEERVTVTTSKSPICLREALPDITRFSSWLRIIRTTARVLLFITKLKTRIQNNHVYTSIKRSTYNSERDQDYGVGRVSRVAAPPASPPQRAPEQNYLACTIDASFLQRAKLLWIRAVQSECFESELIDVKNNKKLSVNSRLYGLSLFVDSDNVLRIKSRIAAAENITEEQKTPAVIDGQHKWTRLYISYVHKKLHHGGFEAVASGVREEFWVIRLRHAVRTEVKSCQQCRVRRATSAQPSTGNHPVSRLAHHQRAFTYTGVDLFGPMIVTVGRRHEKRYGVLFTCLTTRAVHLELAASLSTDSAIMALRRFISRRGCPTEIWSDQGTNLRGADVELRKASHEAMEHEASQHFIRWRFIPPSAPFMGGAWERLVRSVKTALETTLHQRAPQEEVLHTLLVEAEHTINSRPLTHVSTSSEDEEPLTPNHFLLGGPSRVPLPGAFEEDDFHHRRQWRISQRLADMFWARWIREYMPELQHRRQPHPKGVIKLGDLVFIADGTLPRNQWPRGKVTAVYPGPDGEVRAVDVQTNKGTLRRPTKKLFIIPVADNASNTVA